LIEPKNWGMTARGTGVAVISFFATALGVVVRNWAGIGVAVGGTRVGVGGTRVGGRAVGGAAGIWVSEKVAVGEGWT
jgi:hypothetical protein